MNRLNSTNKRTLYKGLGILAAIILLFALLSRRFSGGQTLSEYAAQNAVQTENQADTTP